MEKMFCYQCQESCKNQGCTVSGMCGKKSATANLQDILVYSVKGLSYLLVNCEKTVSKDHGRMIMRSLFATITNANFDNDKLVKMVNDVQSECSRLTTNCAANLPDCVTYKLSDSSLEEDFVKYEASVLSTENEDVRSLRELLVYGLKGIAAYADHAAVLGYEDDAIYEFAAKAMASTVADLSVDEMIGLVLECGNIAVTTMALLDKANTETYGNPEMTTVKTGVKNRPAILISGHDLKDMEQLMEQTKGSGVDVYTHSEMLPANYYPAFKKYDNLVGNYGGSWWHQDREFASFNGVILMTTNCITPVKDSYKDRIFTTGLAGYPGVQHIEECDGKKDFSKIIELAKTLPSPTEIDDLEIIGGFGHNQVMALADKVVDAVKSGAIKRFVVMGGCDGRHKSREYFTEVAENLPEDTIILTAGCAKYRYNKLNLGDIGGIPRVLDAGQCNDSYSLAVIALKLQEVFELEDINELPISFDIAWYEQKAVAVLLALLSLGVKGIRLGPTLPAFLSPTVAQVLIDNFDIKATGSFQSDIENIMLGK